MASSIPLTARAAVLETLGKEYVLHNDYPVKQASELAPGECLIKLEYTGVCHSDLHIKNGDWRIPPLPLIGGHEGVGRVVALSDHSAVHNVKIGDRVGVKWIGDVCLRCDFCIRGQESACVKSTQTPHGYRIHGTFAEYVVSYSNYVTPIPDSLDSAAATPILCAGLTVYKALKQANLTVGDWVAISGAGGGLGHLGVQYAVAMGLRVLAIDTGETKKKLCLSLGAESWVDFQETSNIVADVQAATDGLGPLAAIVVSGSAVPFNQAVMYLRSTGKLLAVGMPAGGATLNVPISLMVAKSLTIIGSAVGNRQDVAEALRLAAAGKVKCQYEIRKLEDLNEVFTDMEAGRLAGRVLLKL